jgi:hypothetical protein
MSHSSTHYHQTQNLTNKESYDNNVGENTIDINLYKESETMYRICTYMQQGQVNSTMQLYSKLRVNNACSWYQITTEKIKFENLNK